MNLLKQIKSFFEVFKAADFSKGLRFATAATLPVVVAGYFDAISVGIPMAVGVLLSSPSDVPGSFHRRVVGVSLSIIAAVSGSIIAGYAALTDFYFIPVLVLLMFGFSMISVFGFRASLISFSGLFAVVLSLANVSAENSVLERAFYIGCGGVWYLVLTALLHHLLRRRETEALLAETFDLTADYLEKRMSLLDVDSAQHEELQKELFDIQTSLNEKHETIRELVITRRRNFGRSGNVRKKLLIFIELVDILELGMANPVNFQKMRELFEERQDQLDLVKEWNQLMVQRLREISQVFKKQKKFQQNLLLTEKKEEVWSAFKDFENVVELPKEQQTLLVLRNLLLFKDKQYHRILSIERLLLDRERRIDREIKPKETEKFLTTQEYDLKTLLDNIDLKSPIFRHSLRLTITMVVGFVLGKVFEFQNAYWILLTILVIMRPGYALTKDRSKQRLYGTLIGGGVAVSIVLLVQNQIVFAVLAVISLVLAFSMIQKNYKTAAAFITLNVVFVYSLLRPDVLEVIQYRVVDTLVGAGLAFLANKFLWPTWEYTGIKDYILASIKANEEFLEEIESLYEHKNKPGASYRLARKKAFLAIGDLNAAFQRMAQEPKSGELDLGQVFSLVALNQEFLASSASLGTFIRSHYTTRATPQFHNYMQAIRNNLLRINEFIEDHQTVGVESHQTIEKAHKYYDELYRVLVAQRGDEKENDELEMKDSIKQQLQEVQIVSDQMKWLWQLSENLKKTLSPINT